MFNSKFTYLFILDVTQDFQQRDTAMFLNHKTSPIWQLQYIAESQYKHDFHYWSVCMFIVRTCHLQSLGRNTWSETTSNLFSSKSILLVVLCLFFFPVLSVSSECSYIKYFYKSIGNSAQNLSILY